MKLSIGLFAAVSAVDSEFELPETCSDYAGVSTNFVNCWKPSGHFASAHNDNGTDVSYYQTNDGGECGFQYIDTGLSLVNKTCPFNPAFDDNYTVGNGVFVAKGATNANQIVGLEITGDFNYVQKWDVEFNWTQDFNDELDAYVAAVDEANKQNTTQPEPFTYERVYDCYPETAGFVAPSDRNCDDLGAPYSDYAIMFTNQQAEDPNNNYAIANYHQGIGTGHVFTVSINKSCEKWGFTAHDPNQATIQVVKFLNECIFTVTVGENHGARLFYFQGSVDDGVIDFINDVTIA